ncbi:MAG: polysaccharide biosynthesis/export family protein [Magnetospiraceae bacterium]
MLKKRLLPGLLFSLLVAIPLAQHPAAGQSLSLGDEIANAGTPRLEEGTSLDLGNSTNVPVPSQAPAATPVELADPFGATLFQGQFSADRGNTVNPGYIIQPGDQIAVRMWGAQDFEGVQTVDIQGNMFIPAVGPVPVAGGTNAELQSRVLTAVRQVFTDQVQVYTNLLGTQPVGVYVTGHVISPGHYAGARTDSILYYLDRAKGVDPLRGSYRDIRVLRNNKVIARMDLYGFMINGRLSRVQLKDGDSIVVGEIRGTATVEGDARNTNQFEFRANSLKGSDMIRYASPLPSVSHVAVRGTRNGQPYSAYIPLQDFSEMAVLDGDAVTFQSDQVGNTIFVSVVGHAKGPSNFALPKGATVANVIDKLEINHGLAAVEATYLRRKSVAERQAVALEAALRELEKSVLTAESSTQTEAAIRVQEAQLVERFVARARLVEPEGRVVLANAPTGIDLALEDGDTIVIPARANLVIISGEVLLPQTVVFKDGEDLDYYLKSAGGPTTRANEDRPVILRKNGMVETNPNAEIEPGDHIMILAEPDNKSLAIFKDLIEVVYRIAVSTAVVLNAF